MKPIKIVSYNTYLIANRFNNNRITNPRQRALKIRHDFLSNDPSACDKESKPPDLCFFQEVWGSGVRELTENLHYYSIPPRRSSLFSWSFPSMLLPLSTFDSKRDRETCQNQDIKERVIGTFFETLKELMDTFYFHWQQSGGLYDFSNPSMVCLYRKKHTFSVSRSKSNKGVEATLWDVPQWLNSDDTPFSDQIGGQIRSSQQTRKRLLVFNTHLDPWHAENRKKQILEIFSFIEETLQSIEKVVGSRAAEGEDLPPYYCIEEKREHNKYDWSKTGVLVLGDFNIKAGSPEYWEILKLSESFSGPNYNSGLKDYFALAKEFDDDNEMQHTYALQNSMVEYPNDCGRIDFIFGLPQFSKTFRKELKHSETQQEQKNFRTFMPLNVVSKSIRKEKIGSESSDHRALILELAPIV